MGVSIYLKPSDESIEDLKDYLSDNSWSGARDRIQGATEEQLNQVCDDLQQLFNDDYVSATTINDFIWFDCDNIFDEDENEDGEEETEDDEEENDKVIFDLNTINKDLQ